MLAYSEMVLKGSLPELKAFLAGLAIGRDEAPSARFSEEVGIECETLGHRLLEKLHLEEPLTYLVVPSERVAEISAACKRAADHGLPFGVHQVREIAEAHCGYEFEIFNREDARALRERLAALPDDLQLVDPVAEEQEDPTAKGAEGYTPEHEYTFKGCGTVGGPLAGVLKARAALAAVPRVKVAAIRLTFTDA
jgi:hypothetical protein